MQPPPRQPAQPEGGGLDALLASAFDTRYLTRLPAELRAASLAALGIPEGTPVDDVVCIPTDDVAAGLRKVTLGDEGTPVSAMQIGMFMKAFRQAVADVEALCPLAPPAAGQGAGASRGSQ